MGSSICNMGSGKMGHLLHTGAFCAFLFHAIFSRSSTEISVRADPSRSRVMKR